MNLNQIQWQQLIFKIVVSFLRLIPQFFLLKLLFEKFIGLLKYHVAHLKVQLPRLELL